jgi:hypothetical protein
MTTETIFRETFRDSDGYSVVVAGNLVTITNSSGKSKECSLFAPRDIVPDAVAKRLRSIGAIPSNFFSMGGYPVRKSARGLIDRAWAAYQEEIGSRIAAEDAAERAAIPGVAELRAAKEDEERYRREFAQMMEDEQNDGVRPPRCAKVSVAEVAKRYPRAAVYLRAEAYSYACHWAKAKAGEEAMQILLAAGAESEAVAKLDNWLSDNNVEVD